MARRRALFGYKINLSATVKQGFVSDFSICKASEDETYHLEEFLDDKTRVVYADKGYMGNRKLLSDLKIADGIHTGGVCLNQVYLTLFRKKSACFCCFNDSF